MEILNELISHSFGVDELPHAPFYEFEYALRFELGGEDWGMNRPIRRFMQAHDRAKSIADFIFHESKEVYAVISSDGDENSTGADFSRLQLCYPDIRKKDFAYRTSYGDGSFRYWHVAKITDTISMHELLWLDIASEMPVEPRSNGHQTYLVDFENSTALHAYDDRGMDVFSTKRDNLRKTYTTFRQWLLAYDIKRMQLNFE